MKNYVIPVFDGNKVKSYSPIGEWYFTTNKYSIEQSIMMMGDLFSCLERHELLLPTALFCDGPQYSMQTCIPMLEGFQPYSFDYWRKTVNSAAGYHEEDIFDKNILVLGDSVLCEGHQKKSYSHIFGVEINLSSAGDPIFFIKIFASHFLPYYLDASAPNPDYQDNYQRLRAFFDFVVQKHPDLKLVENIENSTPYAEMKGLEIKNLTYGDDGSMISIEIHDD